jgi:hypothetical protein
MSLAPVCYRNQPAQAAWPIDLILDIFDPNKEHLISKSE